MKMMKMAAVAVALLAMDADAREPNYDEAKVAPYTLEDPLTFADGRKLKDASEWPARRKEILEIFAREMYGVEPPAPEAVVTEIREEGPTLAGLAIRRQYRMWFKSDKSGPFVDWLLVLPNRIAGEKVKTADGRIVCENREKVPVVLMLNFPGNHAVLDDEEVPLTEGGWFRASGDSGDHGPKESNRGTLRRSQLRTTVPAEFIVSRGYAFLTACYAQVSPDVEVKKGDPEELAYTHVFELWGKRDESRTDNTTALGAWAWALSRGLDLVETIPEIDARKCVATGSSRLGKAALLAAARDERFAVCVPNQTGGGGVPLAKRDFGENVSTEMASFPHWYCKAYTKYIDNEQAMKFDQHLLVAAIAPRALLVEGFNQGWFDAKGEWLSCCAASPVWEFLGKEGLPKGDFPDNYDRSRIGASFGYVRRGGQHGLSGYDWLWMLDFADKALGCSHAIQREIDLAAERGGGRVVVPSGRHVVGQIDLKSNVELHLEKGAVLEGAVGIENYRVTALPYSEGTWSAVVSAIGVTNVAITGEGEIFGNGSAWPHPEGAGGNQEGARPRGVFFADCRDVRLSDFTLRDSACWGVVFKCCDGVDVRRLKIDSHANENNDGIDVEARNVVIADCDIDSGDDAVCIKSNNPGFTVENVLVTNVVARSCCSALKLGTASHGTMRDILFIDCRTEGPRRDFRDRRFGRDRWRFANADRAREFPGLGEEEFAAGAGIAVGNVDGGVVENVTFRRISVKGACVPLFVRAGTRSGRACGTPPSDKRVFRNILLENVSGEACSSVASSITGVDGCRVKDIALHNVHIVCRGGGDTAAARTLLVPEVAGSYPDPHMFGTILPAYGLYLRHVDGLALDNATFALAPGTSDSREGVVCDDVVMAK